jgi:hypothetical protein
MTSIKGRYARIEIPLNKAESGKELHITGDYLSIISVTGEGTCEVKLDHRHSQSIDFREISGITGLFERLYFTCDGEGGVCSIFVGTGMAIHVIPDPEKMWAGGSASAQISTTTTTVEALANAPFKLEDITILNSNGIYACYVGAYYSNLASFKTYAYVLLPHKTLKFGKMDMYALGIASYDAVHNVTVNIIGRYL